MQIEDYTASKKRQFKMKQMQNRNKEIYVRFDLPYLG